LHLNFACSQSLFIVDVPNLVIRIELKWQEYIFEKLFYHSILHYLILFVFNSLVVHFIAGLDQFKRIFWFLLKISVSPRFLFL
tara:strand:- start:463 stop:711 length:249 start_codon:yes stop_codon:yes gene_type:complete